MSRSPTATSVTPGDGPKQWTINKAMERLKLTAAEVQSGGGSSCSWEEGHNNNISFMPPLSVTWMHAMLGSSHAHCSLSGSHMSDFEVDGKAWGRISLRVKCCSRLGGQAGKLAPVTRVIGLFLSKHLGVLKRIFNTSINLRKLGLFTLFTN